MRRRLNRLLGSVSQNDDIGLSDQQQILMMETMIVLRKIMVTLKTLHNQKTKVEKKKKDKDIEFSRTRVSYDHDLTIKKTMSKT